MVLLWIIPLRDIGILQLSFHEKKMYLCFYCHCNCAQEHGVAKGGLGQVRRTFIKTSVGFGAYKHQNLNSSPITHI